MSFGVTSLNCRIAPEVRIEFSDGTDPTPASVGVGASVGHVPAYVGSFGGVKPGGGASLQVVKTVVEASSPPSPLLVPDPPFELDPPHAATMANGRPTEGRKARRGLI
jgi:hypothetical protein